MPRFLGNIPWSCVPPLWAGSRRAACSQGLPWVLGAVAAGGRRQAAMTDFITGLSKASKGSLQELCRLLAVNTEGSKLLLAERALGAIPALRAQLVELRAGIERAQQSLRGQVDGRKNGVKA